MTGGSLCAIDRSLSAPRGDAQAMQTMFHSACAAAARAGAENDDLVVSIGWAAVAQTLTSHRRGGGELLYGTNAAGALHLADRLGTPFADRRLTLFLYSVPSVYQQGTEMVFDSDDPPLAGIAAFDAALRAASTRREIAFVLLRHAISNAAVTVLEEVLELHDVDVSVLDVS
jgi:hypothetical protein